MVFLRGVIPANIFILYTNYEHCSVNTQHKIETEPRRDLDYIIWSVLFRYEVPQLAVTEMSFSFQSE